MNRKCGEEFCSGEGMHQQFSESKIADALKREPPVTGVTDGPHTKNMNTKTVTNIVGFLTLQTNPPNIFSTLIGF